MRVTTGRESDRVTGTPTVGEPAESIPCDQWETEFGPKPLFNVCERLGTNYKNQLLGLSCIHGVRLIVAPPVSQIRLWSANRL